MEELMKAAIVEMRRIAGALETIAAAPQMPNLGELLGSAGPLLKSLGGANDVPFGSFSAPAPAPAPPALTVVPATLPPLVPVVDTPVQCKRCHGLTPYIAGEAAPEKCAHCLSSFAP